LPSSPISWTPIVRILQARIVEGGNRRFAGLRHKRIGGAIIGTGRKRRRSARWDSRHQIAFTGVQSLAHEPAPLGAPDEHQRPTKLVSYEANDLILEPFFGGIRIRKVIRVGANP